VEGHRVLVEEELRRVTIEQPDLDAILALDPNPERTPEETAGGKNQQERR
jgi:hypothetical protein